MKKKLIALCETTNDISETARDAGIPYPTFASASLLARYGGDNRQNDGGPPCMASIVWAVRSALAGILECPSQRYGEFSVFRVDTLLPVSGKADPEQVRILAAVRREQNGRTTLLLALAEAI
jgi:hypothetical protein